QRRWEALAWEAAREAAGGTGGRSALPVQALEDFVAGRPSGCLGAVVPQVRGAYALADLNACLPPFASAGIKEAFSAFDRKIRGFARPDAVLSGVETRTSSPVRITRGDSLESSVGGLFPCGEGAGYAGGIMSAAIDGIRVAEAVARSAAARPS
ncbi:MAG: FAD-dependent oxidoreductase, partial [Spirochaetes bacterium]|nr:FAD-dependent oxidoreductase [Spirochaetota bacterium]